MQATVAGRSIGMNFRSINAMSNLINSVADTTSQLLSLFVMPVSFLDSLLFEHNLLLIDVLLSRRAHCYGRFIESLLRISYSGLVH